MVSIPATSAKLIRIFEFWFSKFYILSHIPIAIHFKNDDVDFKKLQFVNMLDINSFYNNNVDNDKYLLILRLNCLENIIQ